MVFSLKELRYYYPGDFSTSHGTCLAPVRLTLNCYYKSPFMSKLSPVQSRRLIARRSARLFKEELLFMNILIYGALLVLAYTCCYAQRPRLIVERGHSGQVWALAVQPGGNLFVTASDDETFIVFDSETGKEIFRHNVGSRLFERQAVAFSPDGKLLAALSGDSIKIWRVGSWTLMKPVTSSDGLPHCLAFSSDGSILAWRAGSKIVAWDVHDETVKGVFESGPSNIITFHTHDNILVGCRENVELLEISKGTRRPFAGQAASNSQCSSIAVSPDGSKISVSRYDGSISVYDYGTGKEIHSRNVSNRGVYLLWPKDNLLLAYGDTTAIAIDPRDWNSSVVYEGEFASIHVVGYSPKFDTLIVVHGPALNPVITLKKLDKPASINRPSASNRMMSSAAFAKGGQVLATSLDSYIDVWNLVAGTRQCRLTSQRSRSRIFSMAFNDDGDLLESYSGNAIEVWDVKNCRHIASYDVASQMYYSSSAMSGNLQFAVDEQYGELSVHDFSRKEMKIIRFPKDGSYSCRLAFSPDGSLLARANKQGSIKIFDLIHQKQVNEIMTPDGACSRLGFSADNEVLAASNGQLISLFKVKDGAKLVSFAGKLYSPGNITLDNLAARERDFNTRRIVIRAVGQGVDAPVWPDNLSVGTAPGWPWKSTDGIVAYDSDSNRRVSIIEGRIIRFWEEDTPSTIVEIGAGGAFLKQSIIKQKDDSGGVEKRDGRGELCSLIPSPDPSWIVITPDGRFDANELDDVQGLHWVFPDSPFSPLPPEIFMRQFYEPRLLPRMLDSKSKFASIPALGALNRVQPDVEIESVEAVAEHPNIVRVVVKVSNSKGEQIHDGRTGTLWSGAFDLRIFREGQLVGYQPGDLKPGVAGEVTIPFTVRLPSRGDAGNIEFTAYAFNSDRVKSATAKYTYKPDAHLPAVKGRAYIISVGVNAYEDRSWDLGFAASDALVAASALVKGLKTTGEYSEVIPVTLTSDYEKGTNDRRVTERSATKQNFRAVLDALAHGAGKANLSALRDIPGSDRLRKVEPEDLVLIAFSSHGYTDKQGKFYLVPFDTGGRIRYRMGELDIAPESLEHFISSDELSDWVRDIDAGELVMVVDTCHSAAAVDADGFKPGPMGARGMGQLAYDKGMRILAASQADDVALELDKLQQGLLTYALFKDGLGKGKADKDLDGRITLDEWLGYGAEIVPALYADVKAGRLEQIKSRDAHITAIHSGESVRKNAFQQPQLFNFKRNRREVLLATAP
jgi:WD40 repeat protein/uncharacterized caspase-like protein